MAGLDLGRHKTVEGAARRVGVCLPVASDDVSLDPCPRHGCFLRHLVFHLTCLDAESAADAGMGVDEKSPANRIRVPVGMNFSGFEGLERRKRDEETACHEKSFSAEVAAGDHGFTLRFGSCGEWQRVHSSLRLWERASI